MSIATTPALVQTLGESRLLPPEQIADLQRLQPSYADPRALAKELLQRDWLTPYQVNQLFQGKGRDLVLGQYVILERLGEGGMGQVFKARHQTMGRLVALKVIRKDRLANAQAVKRFQREIKAVGQLSHPNVVVAYDADQVGEVHFFAMEYVEGTDLGRLVKDSGPLPVPFACDYIRQGALGLQHAYEMGLVHRDIKPSNLLVAWGATRKTNSGAPKSIVSTGRPVLKLLDLGLARLLDSGEDSGSDLTQEGSVMGTVDYLAPEQAHDSRKADIRSDLYSLGCTFYYLLTGQVPFPGGTATEKLLKHQLDMPTPVDTLRPEIPAGVAAVVRKLMAKAPGERFQTPAEVAEMLSAAPARIGTTLLASNDQTAVSDNGAISPVAPLATFAPSNGLPVAVAVPVNLQRPARVRWPHRLGWKGNVLLAVLGLAAVGGTYLALRPGAPPKGTASEVVALPSPEAATEADLKRLRSHWEDHASDPEALRRFLLGVQRTHPTEPQAVQAAELVELLPSPLDRLDPKKVSAPDRTIAGPVEGLVAVFGDQRMRHWGGPNVYRCRSAAISPNGAQVISGGDDGVVRVWEAYTGRQQMVVKHLTGVIALAYLNNGRHFLGVDAVNRIKIWDAASGKEEATPAGRFLALSPDRRWVLTRADRVGHAQVWVASTHQERPPFEANAKDVTCASFSGDGSLVATAGSDPTIVISDTLTGKPLHSLKGHTGTVNQLRLSADGKTLASWEANSGTLKLWDVTAEKERHSFDRQTMWSLSPDGKALVLRGVDETASRLWDVVADKERLPLKHRDTPIVTAVFSADNSLVATGSTSGDSVKIWDVNTGTERTAPKGTPGAITALAFATDHRTLLTGNSQGLVKLWDLPTGNERQPLSTPPEWFTHAAFSHDGKTLALVSGSSLKLVDTATGKERPCEPAHANELVSLAFSPDDQLLVTGSRDATGKLWDVASGQLQATLRQHSAAVFFVAFSPDGSTVATGDYYAIRFWNTSNGQPRTAWVAPRENGFYPGAQSADGKTVATGIEANGAVRQYDVPAGKEKSPVVLFRERVFGVAYTPDNRMLAARSASGAIKLYDLAAGKERATLPPCAVWGVSPDSQTLVGGDESGLLRVWDAATGEVKGSLEGHAGPVQALAYTPDGQKLATCGLDGRVILWEPLSRKRRLAVWQLPGAVLRVAVAPDGRHVAAVNSNGSVYLLRRPRDS